MNKLKNLYLTLIELLICQGVVRRAKHLIKFTLIELLVAVPAITKRRLLPTKATARVIRFTLIELLVVIGIIIILISILLPALKSAKDTSKKIVCQSNLTQYGKAISMYTVDYDDHLPAGSSYWYNPGCSGYLLNYLGGTGFGGAGGCGEQVYDIMSCPTNPDKFIWATNWSYGKNIWPNVKISGTMVAKNSYRIGIFADGNNYRITYDYFAEPRHSGGTNIIFLDGHTDYRKGYGVVDDDIAWAHDFTTGEHRYNSRGFFATFDM